MARTTLAPTPARLSSLSTRTLSLILELTRSQSLSLPSPSLPSTITKNLSQLREGLETLEGEGDTGEVGRGLRGQYERLVGLAEGLGVEVEGRTGILVDTGEDGPSGDGVDDSSLPMHPLHTAITFTSPADDLEQLEEDEEEMRRANSEVVQMQKRMIEDQDTTLTSLSSAISRQHLLSLSISNELELQSSLLDETDEAVDRTQSQLRRASGRLDDYARRAKMLTKHLNAEKVLQASTDHAAKHKTTNAHTLFERENGDVQAHPRYGTGPMPKFAIPAKGADAEATYQLVHDELSLDGTPILNLASFVHTWMPPQADKLMAENVMKNLIDQDEYPATTLIHNRCVSMIAKLWHADDSKNATGTATTGSSEAIMLGGMAMKRKWQEKMRAAGKDEYPRGGKGGPNVVMGSNAQVAIEKFAKYFECETRLVPVDASTNYCMDPKRAMEYVDENTIGVFVILGSTYTGHYEDVQGMARELDAYQERTGIDVPIHVDGASGAFFAPFATPSLVWDFRIPRVVSINASGHKWGKAYVGVGWAIWRDTAHLPKDLIFELHYLGSVEYTFSLNFSRPAAPIIAQYWSFVHLGFEGYRAISLHDSKNARLLARALDNTKYYKVVSNVHKAIAGSHKPNKGHSDNIDDYEPCLPVVSFQFSSSFRKEFPHIQQKWIQTLMRAKAYIIPNYNLPPNVENEEILRVVVREQFSEDLVERLVTDLIEVTEGLISDSEAGVFGGPSESSAHTSGLGGGRHTGGKMERLAGNHGEGVRAVGHDSVC